MPFPQTLERYMIFPELLREIVFTSPENMVLIFERKIKDDLPKKVHV